MKDIYEKMALFYLGKNAHDDSLSLYKSKHLTTHAAIIGMTGSGKTGLGIGLIEEAAIDNIPSIVIDPKGDMSNLCLAFSQMLPEDYLPWIDESEANAKGKTLQEMAQELAQNNRAGIESFGQDLERVQKFAAVPKTIYTPGSSAGVGVDILGSFAAPPQSILEDADTLASLINTTSSSLLALVGISSDSLNSKEHLLLSSIFSHYYTQGISLSMQTLISALITPPFLSIGMLALDDFYPQKERMKLATLFNSVISSVTFSSWVKGEPLDIQSMLYDEEGKAKIAIFSIAHLSDDERMFFVTLLLNAYMSWMRAQRGSSVLKSILYMDEIFGFFPPLKNPPSKEPMLLLLKQARAFGCGIILSTQNPVDIDYKGLSNIGTWFIGKLQTKQDIAKVLDGIAANSEFSKEELAKQIASLKGRHFLIKNVHEQQTQEFTTRWVLSYLKGPMTKDDIKQLMQERKNIPPKTQPKESAEFFRCKALGLESKPGESQRDFIVRIEEILKELREQKIEKLQQKFQSDYDKLQLKRQKLDIQLKKEEQQVSSKVTDTLIGVGLTLMSAFFGKKALSAATISKGASALTKGKGVLKERADVANAQMLIEELHEQMQSLEKNLTDEINSIREELDVKNYPLEPLLARG